MLFSIVCTDKPASLELRTATRPQHLAYIQGRVSELVLGGPVMDAEGKLCGSLLVIDVEDRQAAEDFAIGDPYARAGLFESTVIRPFRMVFKDGGQVG